MKTGMLWFDNDSGCALDQKIERAASYYLKKYGCAPSVCFVHPSMLPKNGHDRPVAEYTAGEIRVHPAVWILPNHYWLGLNGKEEENDV